MIRSSSRTPFRLAGLAGACVLALTAVTGPASAAAPRTDRGPDCVAGSGESSAARGGWNGHDTRALTDRQIARIEARTQRLLAAKAARADSKGNNGNGKGKPGGGGGGGGGTSTPPGPQSSGGVIPVYVHVMRDRRGNGDVSEAQIQEQIAVLNATYGGVDGDTDVAHVDTGFRFVLKNIDRFDNTKWHADRDSTTYRAQTRQGGSDALNIWLVDFSYLGIATFPWDYRDNWQVDGIRVQYDSLPGGGIANYDQGETATHETGHWLGLYHTFQGGCTETNDQVTDTPAQSSASSGCPEGRDSCSLDGSDPIHNYMDYSFDSCYWEFTPGQKARMQEQFGLYRS